MLPELVTVMAPVVFTPAPNMPPVIVPELLTVLPLPRKKPLPILVALVVVPDTVAPVATLTVSLFWSPVP